MYVGKINELCTDYDHGSNFRMRQTPCHTHVIINHCNQEHFQELQINDPGQENRTRSILIRPEQREKKNQSQHLAKTMLMHINSKPII